MSKKADPQTFLSVHTWHHNCLICFIIEDISDMELIFCDICKIQFPLFCLLLSYSRSDLWTAALSEGWQGVGGLCLGPKILSWWNDWCSDCCTNTTPETESVSLSPSPNWSCGSRKASYQSSLETKLWQHLPKSLLIQISKSTLHTNPSQPRQPSKIKPAQTSFMYSHSLWSSTCKTETINSTSVFPLGHHSLPITSIQETYSSAHPLIQSENCPAQGCSPLLLATFSLQQLQLQWWTHFSHITSQSGKKGRGPFQIPRFENMKVWESNRPAWHKPTFCFPKLWYSNKDKKDELLVTSTDE